MAELTGNQVKTNNPHSQALFKKYVTDIPTIYQCQLDNSCGGGRDNEDNKPVPKSQYGIWLTKPTMGAVTGYRGDGKSTTLAYIGILAKAMGIPVWANFPIRFYFVRQCHDGQCWINEEKELLECDLLDLNYLFTMPDDVQGGLILIDEYGDWAPAYDYNTKRNRLLYAFWGQMRKNQLSFFYSVKFLDKIDTNHRAETDIEINCEDAAQTPFGRKKGYAEGEHIYWHIKDYNRRMTYVPRYMADWYVPKFDYQLYAKPFWGAYDTTKRFDVLDAMSKLKLNLMEKVIGNAPEQEENGHEPDGYHELLNEDKQGLLLDMFSKKDFYPASFVYAKTGMFSNEQKQAVTIFLAHHDIEAHAQSGNRFFRKLGASCRTPRGGGTGNS